MANVIPSSPPLVSSPNTNLQQPRPFAFKPTNKTKATAVFANVPVVVVVVVVVAAVVVIVGVANVVVNLVPVGVRGWDDGGESVLVLLVLLSVVDVDVAAAVAAAVAVAVAVADDAPTGGCRFTRVHRQSLLLSVTSKISLV